MYEWIKIKKPEPLTTGHTQLPRGGVANVSSLRYLAVTRQVSAHESATAHTGDRCASCKKDTLHKIERLNKKDTK